MNLRGELLHACETFLQERRTRIVKTISDIELSLSSETKSSAGDKHETGRAMLQLEREKSGVQLKNLEEQELIFSRLPLQNKGGIVGRGNIVKTSMANYFISISAGAINTEKETYYAISSESPIGQLLMGKKEGETVVFRGSEIKIIKVF